VLYGVRTFLDPAEAEPRPSGQPEDEGMILVLGGRVNLGGRFDYHLAMSINPTLNTTRMVMFYGRLSGILQVVINKEIQAFDGKGNLL
jgi:hypothetical protein